MRHRCNWCGRFISLKDLTQGKASVHMVSHDSECSVEQTESICKKCHEDNPGYHF
jgi:hypothetical protein